MNFKMLKKQNINNNNKVIDSKNCITGNSHFVFKIFAIIISVLMDEWVIHNEIVHGLYIIEAFVKYLILR
jgi:hypothetical protein